MAEQVPEAAADFGSDVIDVRGLAELDGVDESVLGRALIRLTEDEDETFAGFQSSM